MHICHYESVDPAAAQPENYTFIWMLRLAAIFYMRLVSVTMVTYVFRTCKQ